MEFWLHYVGSLPAKASVPQKHAIRQHFHKQLRQLWDRHPALQGALWGQHTLLDGLAQRFKDRRGFAWVPLVRGETALNCSLDILLLRTDAPGAPVRSADLDNRTKLLVDAMTIPNPSIKQTDLGSPDASEVPFCVLLEDDRWVNRISVQAATLLEPVDQSSDVNHVRAVIKVTLTPQYPTGTNQWFVGA